VADIGRDVDRRRPPLELREELGQRRPRAAVLADDDRRHALTHGRERLALVEEAAVVVAVRVDEAWREREASGVDDTVARPGTHPSDVGNAVTDDAHRSRSPRRAGPVEDEGVRDYRARRSR
jgi:hypothetical protein